VDVRTLIEERSGNTTNVYNTFSQTSYSFIDNNPQDDLLTSVYSNGYPCSVPPPIDVLPTSGFFDDTFRTLERTWSRLKDDLNIPGVAIAIVYKQRVLYNGTLGVLDKTSNNPVRSDSLFRIGGLTRLFTSILTYQQRDQQKLRLEQPLKSLLPNLQIVNPFTSDDISIRSVITELSGLPRNTPPGCEPFACNLTTAQVLHLIATAKTQLINPPFLLPLRSDLGWSLVGRGMESIPGFGTYEGQVKSAITDVLGMKDTVFAPTTEQRSRTAAGHANGGAITNYDLGWNRPWGGLYSTLNDMIQMMLTLNLVDAQSNGLNHVLASDTLRELLLPAFMNPDSKTGQGSPFQMFYFLNRLTRSLNGYVNGYSSHLLNVPGLRISMLVMTNSGQVDASRFSIPAVKLLIPLIQNQLLKQQAGPQPAPNATIFSASFLGVDSRGRTGTLTVKADDEDVLTVYDSRFTIPVAYQLDYIGLVNNGTAQRFKVNVIGTDEDSKAFLTCINIFDNGADNDFMDFSSLGLATYRTLLFQGEVYQKVDNEVAPSEQMVAEASVSI